MHKHAQAGGASGSIHVYSGMHVHAHMDQRQDIVRSQERLPKLFVNRCAGRHSQARTTPCDQLTNALRSALRFQLPRRLPKHAVKMQKTKEWPLKCFTSTAPRLLQEVGQDEDLLRNRSWLEFTRLWLPPGRLVQRLSRKFLPNLRREALGDELHRCIPLCWQRHAASQWDWRMGKLMCQGRVLGAHCVSHRLFVRRVWMC